MLSAEIFVNEMIFSRRDNATAARIVLVLLLFLACEASEQYNSVACAGTKDADEKCQSVRPTREGRECAAWGLKEVLAGEDDTQDDEDVEELKFQSGSDAQSDNREESAGDVPPSKVISNSSGCSSASLLESQSTRTLLGAFSEFEFVWLCHNIPARFQIVMANLFPISCNFAQVGRVGLVIFDLRS